MNREYNRKEFYTDLEKFYFDLLEKISSKDEYIKAYRNINARIIEIVESFYNKDSHLVKNSDPFNNIAVYAEVLPDYSSLLKFKYNILKRLPDGKPNFDSYLITYRNISAGLETLEKKIDEFRKVFKEYSDNEIVLGFYSEITNQLKKIFSKEPFKSYKRLIFSPIYQIKDNLRKENYSPRYRYAFDFPSDMISNFDLRESIYNLWDYLVGLEKVGTSTFDFLAWHNIKFEKPNRKEEKELDIMELENKRREQYFDPVEASTVTNRSIDVATRTQCKELKLFDLNRFIAICYYMRKKCDDIIRFCNFDAKLSENLFDLEYNLDEIKHIQELQEKYLERIRTNTIRFRSKINLLLKNEFISKNNILDYLENEQGEMNG